MRPMIVTTQELCTACQQLGQANPLMEDTLEPLFMSCINGHRVTIAAPAAAPSVDPPAVVAEPIKALGGKIPPSFGVEESTKVIVVANLPTGDLLVTAVLAERHKTFLASEAQNTGRSIEEILTESLNSILDNGFLR